MTATKTNPILPPHALPCWCDDVAIYIAMPTLDGGYYIQSFTRSEQGLGKALSIIRAAFEGVKKSNGGQAVVFDQMAANRGIVKKVGKSKEKYTEEQMETAQAVLRKMGLI